MFIYLFKTLELVRYYQNDFDPRIDVLLYFWPTKQQNLTNFLQNRHLQLLQKSLWNQVKYSEEFAVEKCRRKETYSDISDISELLTGLSCQTLAMIFFPLLPVMLSSNLVNLNSYAKAIAEK